MIQPNVLTPCWLLTEHTITYRCTYTHGIRLLQTCGSRGIPATLVLESGGYLAQTLAERRYFTDKYPS